MLLLFASLLIATTFACTSINKNAINWESYKNQLYLNGKRFNMKGLSWFGFETGRGQLDGLDKHPRSWYFQWMVDRGFNAIRMPFASNFLRNGGYDAYIDAVMAAGDYGIFVMLDMHSATEGSWMDGLDTINKATEIATWRTLAEKLVAKGAWNILFVDVFNEPHDVSNDEWGDWIDFCEDVAEAVWGANLNALIAVEGTNWDCQDTLSCAWGENLIGVKNKGITFSKGSNKFVWSPHVYGGDVTGNYNYNTDSWEAHWAYLVTEATKYNNGAAIVIGEFGTKYTGSMIGWLNTLIDYLISIDQRNHFYWCLNPNSGDTGGLLQDDWTTPQTAKLNALDKLQPNPSTVTTVSSNKICVDGLGESADAPSGSSPGNSPTPKPTSKPTAASSTSGKILIKENANSNQWWLAIEFPNNDNGAITKLQMRDSGHTSWITGNYESWGSGAYSFEAGGSQFYGKQHFRVNGKTATWNVFNGVSGGSTAYINLPGSSYTEEEAGASGSQIAGIVAGIIVALLCVACIIGGVYWYKKHSRLNKGEASFNTTAADTPEVSQNKGGDTPISDEMPQQTEDVVEAEIEIEMEMETTQ